MIIIFFTYIYTKTTKTKTHKDKDKMSNSISNTEVARLLDREYIDPREFWEDHELLEAFFSNVLISIGYFSFSGCSNLHTISPIPNSLDAIGQGAFLQCESLRSVTFQEDSTLTFIGPDAFHSCESLTELVIPKKVTYIGSGAFAFCRGLKRIVIQGPVKVLIEDTFDTCESLEYLRLPNTIKEIQENVFIDCNPNMRIDLGIIEHGDSTQTLNLPQIKNFQRTYSNTVSFPNGEECVITYTIQGNKEMSEATLTAETSHINQTVILQTLDGEIYEVNIFNSNKDLKTLAREQHPVLQEGDWSIMFDWEDSLRTEPITATDMIQLMLEEEFDFSAMVVWDTIPEE